MGSPLCKSISTATLALYDTMGGMQQEEQRLKIAGVDLDINRSGEPIVQRTTEAMRISRHTLGISRGLGMPNNERYYLYTKRQDLPHRIRMTE